MSLRELPEDFQLAFGSHGSFSQGACVMEAVAYVSGEPHSYRPQCVSWVLGVFAIGLNDGLDDQERQLLLPLISKLAGTASSVELDLKRAFFLTDACLHRILPLVMKFWNRTFDNAITPIVDALSAENASQSYMFDVQSGEEDNENSLTDTLWAARELCKRAVEISRLSYVPELVELEDFLTCALHAVLHSARPELVLTCISVLEDAIAVTL